jgi:hypothetical protein
MSSITQADIDNGKRDLDDLALAVNGAVDLNGNGTFTTREGVVLKTLLKQETTTGTDRIAAATSADEAEASAASINVDKTGNALSYMRVNAGENAFEFRTPAQVLADINVTTQAESVWKTGTSTVEGLVSPAKIAAVIANTSHVIAAGTLTGGEVIFLDNPTSGYDELWISISNLRTSAEATVQIRLSSNSGSIWYDSTTDYSYATTGLRSDGTTSKINSNSADHIKLIPLPIYGALTLGRLNGGRINLAPDGQGFMWGSFAYNPRVSGTIHMMKTDFSARLALSGTYNSVKIFTDTGTIVSGNFHLYGTKN